ncbi:ABC transporter permease [Hymenobacter weizhouensis]|uniref:ABC transporter permease n=1 Tax=Hymenobacter sp. YIM 151500-1 TaxID=2987689 RepID=UPI002226DFCC|nr:ABC transporter permease [Hymenobacter sp. YIM 151500-1]UYZ63044.1 ABC transporter permease [Hymenobacter sp. YIM 151500-1]
MGRTLLLAWLVLSALFLLSRSAADPAAFVQQALESSSRVFSPAEQQAATRQLLRRYGLDEPVFYVTLPPQPHGLRPAWQWHGLHNQYHRWVGGLLRGDLGFSFRDGAPVAKLVGRSLRYTLPLTGAALALSVAAAVGGSLLLNYHRTWRPTLLAVLHALQALPLFLVALGLLLLLANPDALSWFPVFGLDAAELSGPWWAQAGRQLPYLVLPITSLVLVSAPALLVQLDGALQHELRAPYIATARAKGASRWGVLRHHALRNALLPGITLAAALLPEVVAGSVVVEVLFALPGMGRLLAEAAASQDYPVLLGGVTLVVVVRLLAQALADILYQAADPRVRIQP